MCQRRLEEMESMGKEVNRVVLPQEMRDFIRGMALHDLAKPLYLPGGEHTLLGYAFLSAMDRPTEALVTLLHHSKYSDA